MRVSQEGAAVMTRPDKTRRLIFSAIFIGDALLLFVLIMIIVTGKGGVLQPAGNTIASVAWPLRLLVAIPVVGLSIALRAWSLTQFLQQQLAGESTFDNQEISQERPSLSFPPTQPTPDNVAPSQENTSRDGPVPFQPTVDSARRRPTVYDRVRDPEDLSDLEEHPHMRLFPASEEHNVLRYGWRVIGASRRGYSHAYEGKYREDDFHVRLSVPQVHSYGLESDIALIAIADGVGSKRFSRRGARAAVLGATEVEEAHLQELAAALTESRSQYEAVARSILLQALHTASCHVKSRAQLDMLDISELHSTLLVFLVAPCNRRQVFVASAQVGDSCKRQGDSEPSADGKVSHLLLCHSNSQSLWALLL